MEAIGTTTDPLNATTCPNCASPLIPGAKFCPQCGTQITTKGTRATFGPRYAAFLVDLSLILFVWLAQSLFTQPISRLLPEPRNASTLGSGAIRDLVGAPLELTLLFVVAAVYFAATQAKRRTVGERAVGLRLRRITGEAPGLSRSVIRSLVFWGPLIFLFSGNLIGLFGSNGLARAMAALGSASFLLIWIASLAMTLFWRQRRGIHDLAAGTELIRD